MKVKLPGVRLPVEIGEGSYVFQFFGVPSTLVYSFVSAILDFLYLTARAKIVAHVKDPTTFYRQHIVAE